MSLTGADRGRQPAWAVALLFAGLTALITWPQVLHPLSIPAHTDTYFSLWRLGWIAHQLPRDPWHLFDANIFTPLRHTLAFSDAVLLQALVAAPFIWTGVPIVFIYSVEVLVSFVLCGLGMFLLVRDLTRSPAAGVLAGLIFAFAPYRFDHYIHLELLWTQWMPFTLWMFHRTLTTGRLRDGVMTGVFMTLQGLSCIYLGVFFLTAFGPAALLLLMRTAVPPRRIVAALALGGLVFGAVMYAYRMPYTGARDVVGGRASGEASLYSAGPKHYFSATPDNLIYGPLTGDFGRHEKRLFPGLVAFGLLITALWPPVDRRRLAYALTLVIAVIVSFGPPGIVGAWLQATTEVYQGLRVFARMGGVALVAIAVLAGFGAARVLAWIERRPWRPAVPVTVLAGAVMFGEYLVAPRELVPVDTTAPPAYAWLAGQPRGVVAELPLPRNEPADLIRYESIYAYNSTFHFQPLVNGYSGFWAAPYIAMVRAVRGFPDAPALDALRAHDVRYILIHERFYGREQYAALLAQVAEVNAMTPLGRFKDDDFEIAAFGFGR